MNAKAMLRWSAVLSTASATYWFAWWLIHGTVPVFHQIGELGPNGTPVALPVTISRWWDIAAWPLLICMIKAISLTASRIDAAPTTKVTVSAVVGVIISIIGAVCAALVAIVSVVYITPFVGAIAALTILLLFASLASVAYWGGYHLIESPLRRLAKITEPVFNQGLRWMNGQE